MKLYNSVGPNPRIVRLFAAEKGIELPLVAVDLMKGENRQADHLKRNPAGQMPSLETDSGAHIAEVTVICEYLEEKFPTPALIGTNAEERANTRMWTRRVDLNICEPMANGFRNAEGLPLFKARIPTDPTVAPGLKMIAQDREKWLSDMKAPSDQFLCGNRFTMADILLFCFVDFGIQVGQPLNPEAKWLAGWYERVKARPSAAA